MLRIRACGCLRFVCLPLGVPPEPCATSGRLCTYVYDTVLGVFLVVHCFLLLRLVVYIACLSVQLFLIVPTSLLVFVCAPVVRLPAHGLAVQVCAMICGSVQRVHMFPQPPGCIWHAPRVLGSGMLWSRTLVSRMTSGSISHHATSDLSRVCAQTSPALMCITIPRQCCTHRRLMYSYIYTSYIYIYIG